MKWQILDTGQATGQQNMDQDWQLLQDLNANSNPILHLYDWSHDTASYGHFIKPFEHLKEEGVAKHGLQLARRPTGGGVILHVSDFAYSCIIPAAHPRFSLNTFENYAWIHSLVAQVIQRFAGQEIEPDLLAQESIPENLHCKHFCMAKPTRFDVMLNGRKVGGGAQRRTRKGFLHQGTISLAMPTEAYLTDILKVDAAVLQGMRKHGGVLIGSDWTRQDLLDARFTLKNLLAQMLTEG